MNPTIEKFGFPATLLREFDHWVILLRPTQVTLGSLVLAANGEATRYSELPDEAFAEQAQAVKAIENGLAKFCAYERINYLMLMMVDLNVHFHVIPRYSVPRSWSDIEIADEGWPGPPILGRGLELSKEQIAALTSELADCLG